MPTRKVGVIVIHGFGGHGTARPASTDDLTFSAAMSRRVRRKLGDDAARLAWREVFWSDILRNRQDAYLEQTCDSTGMDGRRALVMAAMSDAVAYDRSGAGPGAVYEAIHARFEIAMRDMEADIGPNGQVLILAHSLGGHVASNYIYDLQKFRKRAGQGRFASPLQNMRTVAGVMTFGCNIPIFLFGHPAEAIKPIDYPGADIPDDHHIMTWWQNFYDKQDILAYPIGPAASRYAQMVADRALRDVPVRLGTPEVGGWDPLTHGSYWDDAELITPVVHYINKMLG